MTINNKIEKLAQDIENWDTEYCIDLLNKITELKSLLTSSDFEHTIEQYVDFSELPSVNFPSEFSNYPVWAVDKQGNALVGESADTIQSIGQIEKFYFNNIS